MKIGSKKVYIDSCVLIAFLVPTLKHHKDAKAVMSGIKTSVISFLTLNESFYVLHYELKIKKAVIKKHMNMLLNSDVQVVSMEQNNNTALKYLTAFCKSNMRPSDCLHALIIKANRIKYIATFDKDLSMELAKKGVRNTARPVDV